MLARTDRRAYIIETAVTIGDQTLQLRANARSPQVYRVKVGRDLFVDLDKMRAKYQKILNLELDEHGELVRLDTDELTTFADIFYLFHSQAQPDTPWRSSAEMLDDLPVLPATLLIPEVLRIWNANKMTINAPKESHPQTVREFSTALYLLRCAELGLSSDDLDALTIGAVSDMLAEKADDRVTFNLKATPELMEKLFGG